MPRFVNICRALSYLLGGCARQQILLICSHYARAMLPRDLKAPNASEHFGSLDVHIQGC